MDGERMGKTSDSAYRAAIGNEYHRVRLGISIDMLKWHIDLAGKRAFDFGCGEGVFMRALHELGAAVTGCDISAELVPEDAKLGGVEVLEVLPSESLDVLAVLNVLSYMDDAERARFWAEARRTVKPGGLLVTCNPNAFAAAKGRYTWITDPDSFPRFLKENGFREVEADFFRYYPTRLARLLGAGRERVIDRAKLKRIPIHRLRRRSTGYFSLAQRS